MTIGINQILLLHQCLLTRGLNVTDAKIYYNIEDGRRRLTVLEQLQFKGFLKTEGREKFVLTSEGRKIIREKLNHG